MSGKRFAGRRALVTGASRGIGAALAERLAAEGADVALTARSLDRAAKLPGTLAEVGARLARYGGRVALIGADLADEADRDRVVPEAEAGLGGPVDILVNNAAMGVYAPVADYPLRRARLHYEINVIAPLHLAQAALPGMRERGQGWIVNLSSGTARPWAGPPFTLGGTGTGTTVYGSSKAALNRLTNGLAAELYGTGVRVNTVEPRAAVMSEGAQELVGHIVRPDQVESMEEMVEGALALCDCPPGRTGGVEVSLALIAELGLTVHGLDGSPRAV
ncbi:SDR family NAD(P)-dependent oxidoreductase [Yinghuangia seranimata]|uniref:SDR family NAD(P)-dependent oxidoreductase n=1 Tax=Yinghuangia seranimata TaxID=408067 RepID=UPI00248C0DD6|nr:SDR family NAD(P)-dependent oxidoreductase [Yinghuangia seranimata]MDI2125292.1 SDR family NAD(P)-dependent oxidoreductase [Yinghuangia seranimata]